MVLIRQFFTAYDERWITKKMWIREIDWALKWTRLFVKFWVCDFTSSLRGYVGFEVLFAYLLSTWRGQKPYTVAKLNFHGSFMIRTFTINYFEVYNWLKSVHVSYGPNREGMNLIKVSQQRDYQLGLRKKS